MEKRARMQLSKPTIANDTGKLRALWENPKKRNQLSLHDTRKEEVTVGCDLKKE